jgi:MFS transporter, DHA1 family, tetracycline resistance protein
MRKPSLLVIFLAVFIDLIGFGIVMPILPLYGKQFGASGIEVGVIFAAFSAMQFFFSPIWGRLSDRIGRRPVMLISLAGSAVAYAMFALASLSSGRSGLWLLLASRLFAGACGGNINVAQAYIADISPPDKRSARMALIGVAFGLGFIFGPVIGAVSGHYGLAMPGWIATGLCAFNFLLACAVLTESLRPDSRQAEQRPHWDQWAHTLKTPQVGALVGLFFLATFCFASFEYALGLMAQQRFHYDTRHVGYLYAFSGVISVLAQGGMIRPLVKRFGEARLIVLSLSLMGLGLAVLPYLTTLPLMLAGLALVSFATSIYRPPTFGLISILTPPTEQGATLGVAQGAGSLARIFGPLAAGPLFDWHAALPCLVAGVISLLAGGLAWRFLNLAKETSPLPPEAAKA